MYVFERKDPTMLLRFIHARGNVKEAVTQYTNMCEWRKTNDIESLEEENLPAMLMARHYTSEGLWGETKEGQVN